MLFEDRLIRRRLILVMGKGGVGKSVMTAVVGQMLASRGRRALILEVDPRENLHQLLDIPPSGGEIAEVAENLHLQNLKPRQVVDWIVERQVKIGFLVRRVRRSPIYHRFVEGAPGLTQIAILGHALRLARGDFAAAPAVDTVVLDAPATGHGIYLLTAARLLSEAIGEGPVASLAREVAEFVADPDKAGLVVVTHAEEMPVEEAVELRQALGREFGREPELLVVNAVYPAPPAKPAADATAARDPLLSLWRRRRRVNEIELERLAEAWPGPRIELPLLPIDQGPELVGELRRRFEAALAGLGEGPWT